MYENLDNEVCILCLSSGDHVDIFEGNDETEFVVNEAIEDLLNVKVSNEPGCSWLICTVCLRKLSEFRLFKLRSSACVYEFYQRFQRRCFLKDNRGIIRKKVKRSKLNEFSDGNWKESAGLDVFTQVKEEDGVSPTSCSQSRRTDVSSSRDNAMDSISSSGSEETDVDDYKSARNTLTELENASSGVSKRDEVESLEQILHSMSEDESDAEAHVAEDKNSLESSGKSDSDVSEVLLMDVIPDKTPFYQELWAKWKHPKVPQEKRPLRNRLNTAELGNSSLSGEEDGLRRQGRNIIVEVNDSSSAAENAGTLVILDLTEEGNDGIVVKGMLMEEAGDVGGDGSPQISSSEGSAGSKSNGCPDGSSDPKIGPILRRSKSDLAVIQEGHLERRSEGQRLRKRVWKVEESGEVVSEERVTRSSRNACHVMESSIEQLRKWRKQSLPKHTS